MFQENYNEAENIGAKVNAAMRDEREPGLETLQRFSYLCLLHATIADAISWGCTSLSLGRIALEPKAALGAKPEPMSVWLRHRVLAMNWMLRGILGAVTHDAAPERNPFKAASDSTFSSP